MAEPVFNVEDRVPLATNDADLPPELRGKSPVEIAKFYQHRENQIKELAKKAIQANQPAPTTTTTTTQVRPITVEETEAARGTLTENAKRLASEGKEFWKRLLPDIEKVMANCKPEDRTNWQVWETCYFTLAGQNAALLAAEKAQQAAEAARIASERPNPATEQQAPPPPLPAIVVSKVLPGLDITEEQYRTAEKQMAATPQTFPLTFKKYGRPRVEPSLQPGGNK